MRYICYMEINEALIDKLAHLSRLSFEPDEKKRYQADLQRMIHFVDKLNELDTTGVEPLRHLNQAKQVLRDDTVREQLHSADALKNAAHQDGAFFLVPKVIKK